MEEYEEYEEYEERGGNRLWIILFALACVIAVVFATLWYLRGGDINRLNNAITANQSVADATTGRLDRELRTARSDADAGKRRIEELEKQIRDEQRRATDMAQQVERRLRNEADAANARVLELTTQLTQAREEMAGKGGAEGIAADSPAAAVLPLASVSELDEVKRQLTDARESAEAREKELYQRLADAVKEKDELAATVGDLKASLNNIGLELTTANEDSKDVDTLREQASSLQTRIAEAQETIKTLEEKVGDLEANNSHLRREMLSMQEELSGKAGQAQAASEASGAQLAISEGGIGKELAAAGTAIAAATAAGVKIHDLEAKLAEAQKSVEELKGDKNESASAIEKLRADLAQAEADLTAARSGSSESADKIAAAEKTIDELRGQVAVYEAEQEKLRKELSELNIQLQQAQSEAVKKDLLESELAAAKKTAEEAAGQITTLTETQDGLRKDLAAAYADLKKIREGTDVVQSQSELENRIEALTADLNAAKDLNARAQESIGTLQSGLEQARAAAANREKELGATVERLEKENASILERLETWRASAPKAEGDGTQQSVGKDVHDAISRLESEVGDVSAKGLKDAKARIAQFEQKVTELESANTDLVGKLNVAMTDLKAVRENAAKQLTDVRKEYDNRLAAVQDKLSESAAKADAKEVKDGKDGKAGDKKAHSEETAEAAAPATPKLAETPAGASGLLSEAAKMPDSLQIVEVIEPSSEPTEPVHFYLRDPSRSVGEITGMAQTGGFEINVGTRQGVKPGMLFDVHRPLGKMSWFIGVLRVDRTMNNTSEATLISSDGVKICPVSGRAVLDPSSRFSPFVYADNGKAVPLIPAESLGLGGEMPVIGDRVDNPFFKPYGRFLFALSPELSAQANRGVSEAIAACGGEVLPKDGNGDAADYLVVPEEDPASITDKPSHVTPEQVESYVVQ